MSNSSAKVFAAVAALAAMTVVPARADIITTKTWVNFCLVGSVRTCASVQVETTQNPNDHNAGTAVVLRIRNLQGTNPFDNTGGSLITALGLTAPDIGTVSGPLVVTTSGNVGIIGSPAGRWEIRNPYAQIGGQVSFSASTISGDGGELRGGIQGCDLANAGAVQDRFVTCGLEAGWVEFRFRTTGYWNAGLAEVAWKVQSAAVNGQSYECRTADVEGQHVCTEMEVVPEPVSLVLLGSGLAGMGGVGLFRRRKRNGDVENV